MLAQLCPLRYPCVHAIGTYMYHYSYHLHVHVEGHAQAQAFDTAFYYTHIQHRWQYMNTRTVGKVAPKRIFPWFQRLLHVHICICMQSIAMLCIAKNYTYCSPKPTQPNVDGAKIKSREQSAAFSPQTVHFSLSTD